MAFHEDAEREGCAEVELAGDELDKDAGEKDAVEREQRFERGPRSLEKQPEEEGKQDGDESGLGASEEEQQADGASEYGGDAARVPLQGEADEDGAERGGEHRFHAVELIAFKDSGAGEGNDDDRQGAQDASQPIALGVGGDGPGQGDHGGDGEDPGTEEEFCPGVSG